MDENRACELIIQNFNTIMGANYSFAIAKSSLGVIARPRFANAMDIICAITQWKEKAPNDNNLDHFINWYGLIRPEEQKKEKEEKETKTTAKEMRRKLAITEKELKEVQNGFSAALEKHAREKEEWEKKNNELATSMKFLSDAITKQIAETKISDIESTVVAGLKERIDQYIFSQYGRIEKKVDVISDYGHHEINGILHKKFDTVMKFVANNEPVYLVGPAGSGKNVICKQVAEALGLEFYFSNAVTQEYKITGFTDANGHFHESQFYKAFTHGGLFMLDEMDASIPEVLIILNAAIANRYFDFPAPIGKVEANENFRVVAAGNTFGHGADTSYVGRNTLDAASLDRFAMVEVEYDDGIAMNVTNNNRELVNFCNIFRKAAKKAGIDIVVSYRAMSRMAKMDGLMDRKDLIKTCLVKGLEADDLRILMETMKYEKSEYLQDMFSVVSEAQAE